MSQGTERIKLLATSKDLHKTKNARSIKPLLKTPAEHENIFLLRKAERKITGHRVCTVVQRDTHTHTQIIFYGGDKNFV